MLSQLDDPAVLPDELLITAITLAELTVGPLVATTDHERAARQAHLQQSEADCYAVTFDANAARTFGRVAASLWQSGRRVLARWYDAMIAAIALTHALPCLRAIPVTSPGSTGSRWSPCLCRSAESRQSMVYEGSAMSS